MTEKALLPLTLFLIVLIIFCIYVIYRTRKNICNYTVDVFNTEFELLKEDKVLVDFLKTYFSKVPKEFWIMPASTSGKYHPLYALGKGGLIRHTKAAIKIANSLLPLEMYNHLNKNLVITALMVHDSVKPGFSKDGKALKTQSEHPLFAVNLLDKTFEEFKQTLTSKEAAILEAQLESVKRMVKSHMGQWNTNKEEKVILPKPEKEDEKFVHLCDYLASRRFINIDLEEVK